MRTSIAKIALVNNNQLVVYRGCSCGCIYCDKYSSNHNGLAFSDVEVKSNIVEVLDKALFNKGIDIISIGDNCEPYQMIEKKEELIRKSLEVIYKHGFGVVIKTSSKLILRDIDILEKIAKKQKATVIVKIASINDALARIIEPNLALPLERIDMVSQLSERGINVVVEIAPIIPFITDNRKNINDIVVASKKANAKAVICNKMGFSLKNSDKALFYKTLENYFPKAFEKYAAIYKNKNDIISLESFDLFNYFNACCVINEIENNSSILEEAYLPKYNQMSIFDFI